LNFFVSLHPEALITQAAAPMGSTLETEEVHESVRPTAVPAIVPGSCICSPADVETLATIQEYDFTGARFLGMLSSFLFEPTKSLVTGEQWACEQIVPMFGYKLVRKYETVYWGDGNVFGLFL
jgi:hypothetical protein